MIKKFLAQILSMLMLLSCCTTVTVSADALPNLADNDTLERPANLIPDDVVITQDNETYFAHTTQDGVNYAPDANGTTGDCGTNDTARTKVASYYNGKFGDGVLNQGAAPVGGIYTVGGTTGIKQYFKDMLTAGKTFVVSMDVWNRSANDTDPRVLFVAYQSNVFTQLPKEYSTYPDAQAVTGTYDAPMTASATFKLPENTTAQYPMIAVGYPEDAASATVDSSRQRNLGFDLNSFYIAEEAANKIEVTADKTTIQAGSSDSINVSASVLNQVGLEGYLEQDVEWYVVNRERTESVTGINYSVNDDGTLTVTAADYISAGTYCLVARSVKYPSLVKGIEIDIQEASYEDKDYAYWVQNFDDGNIRDAGDGVGYNTTITDGVIGKNGDKALKITTTEAQASPEFDVVLRGNDITYDISMWVRADEDVADEYKEQFSVVFSQKLKESVSGQTTGWVQVFLDLEKPLKKGEWVYAHKTFTFNGKGNIDNATGEYDLLGEGGMTLRVGNGSETAVMPSANGIDFSVDDITVMPKNAYYKDQTPNEICEGMELYTLKNTYYIWDYNNGDGWRLKNSKATINRNYTHTISGVNETLEGYVAISDTDENTTLVKEAPIDIRHGICYYLSYWAKADNDSAKVLPNVYIHSSYRNIENEIEFVSVTGEESGEILYSSDTKEQFKLTDEWRRYLMKIKIDELTTNTIVPDYIGYRLSTRQAGQEWSMGNFRIYQAQNDIEKNVLKLNTNVNAYKTGNNECYIEFDSGVQYGGVTDVITRVLVPYNNGYVIKKSYKGSTETDDSFYATLDETEGMKIVSVAKDKDDYFSVENVRHVEFYDEQRVTAIAEFNQPVWSPDMKELTADIYYNNASGSETLLALCTTYDENNRLITSDVQEFDLLNGEGSIKLSMDVSNKDAKTAKVFLWDKLSLAPKKESDAVLTKNTEDRFIFVDINGSDTNDGGYMTPLKTISQAISLYKNMQSDAYIVLMPGYHVQEKELAITNEHTSDLYKLTITSYDKNKKSVISGGKIVTGFEPHDLSKGIYKATVDKGLTSRELYVNGIKATRARSEGKLTGFTNTTIFRDPDSATNNGVGGLDTLGHLESVDTRYATMFSRPTDLEFVFYSLWTNSRCRVSSVETYTNSNGKAVSKFNMVSPCWKNLCSRSSTFPRTPIYMENALELLDQEGEWYMNSDDGILYYKPRTSIGENISNAEVILPVIDNLNERLLSITGVIKGDVAENITFDNVTFAHTTWSLPSTDEGFIEGQNGNRAIGNYPWNSPEGAVDVQFAENIDFTNCVFAKLGITGLRLAEGAKKCDIIANEFYDISGSAVSLGLVGRDKKDPRLYRNPLEYNMVDSINFTNNYIHNVATDYQGTAAVSVGYPSNTLIANNEICFIPYTGIHMGYGWDQDFQVLDGNGVEIGLETGTNLDVDVKDNYIHDLFYEGKLYDGGAIYTLSKSKENCTNVISGNYITNIGPGASAIYNDQGSSRYDVNNNVIDLDNSYGTYSITTGRWKGPSTWMNVNVGSDTYKHNLVWSNNYSTLDRIGKMPSKTTMEKDETMSFENAVLGYSNGVWVDEAARIIEQSGIQDEYIDNFRYGLRSIVVPKTIRLSTGNTVANSPTYISVKNMHYKSKDILYYSVSDNEEVATIDENNVIRAVGKGTATITYVAIEGNVIRTAKTIVTVV